MSLNSTPSANRIHIGFFGRRNAGKSSLVNAFTGQDVSIVAPVKGTTTDPVAKSMELLPLGPVMIYDTPGLDDTGEVGKKRVEKGLRILDKTDIAVLVVASDEGIKEEDEKLLALFKEKNINYIIVYNKSDIKKPDLSDNAIAVSAVTGEGVPELKEAVANLVKDKSADKPIVKDLICAGDFVVLVVPIDSAAPKGRLILPQQQTIRDILEAGAMPVVCRDSELEETLAKLGTNPSLVICDSQVFGKVDRIVSKNIPLTSFSILFARYKGNLESAVKGAKMLDSLKDGDKVLIAEGCTHHRQCGDIGSVKIPAWLKKHTGADLEYVFSSGGEFAKDFDGISLIIHCGGCMLNEREMQYRYSRAEDNNVPVTNYGIAIAHLNGILKRSIEIFPDLYKLFE